MTIAAITILEAAIVAAFFMLTTRSTRAGEHRVDRLVSLIEDTHESAHIRTEALIDKFAQILTAPHPDVAELIALTDRLCQRIQAPAVAVGQHLEATTPVHVPQAVSMFDDADHWGAQLTKEQLAEQAMRAEQEAMTDAHVG